ncbi:MAG: hydroxyacid dehydrogenase [Bacteriovoracaceae bacterium]
MEKPHIVVCDGFDKTLFEELKNISEFNVHPTAKNTQEEIQGLLSNMSAAVIRSATKVDADFLEKAPNLKYVIRAGEGTDNIDKVSCQQKGVKVSNTPGANNNSAAEHAIALMFTVLRNTAYAHQSMMASKWEKAKFTGIELSNKKIGIVGFGRIGRIVAKRLAGFEPEVLFFDPFIKESDIPYAKKAENLEEIFSSCDIVTIHVPLMEQTRNLITKDLLEKMPSHSILVNASRGGILNEQDLYDTLKENKIRGAGLDVFANEPLEENSPLRELDNLVLTPHLGASTAEAQVRVGEMVIHQLKEFFINNNLLNEVKV